ncbi:MAG: NfeD family protein [Gammaproteobacteria bacterium]|nr:NfeD family protein [Gammaproteobacteria bacterium]
MQWWAWIAVGAILLGAELAFVDAQFYLVFVGAAALLVGAAALAGLLAADWLQWLCFVLLAVFGMLTFRRRIYERIRRVLPAVRSGPAGDTVILAAPLAPGEGGRLEYRGTTWNALNGGTEPIAAGARARIERVEGLTLVLRRHD